jgi:hypothetical protein
MTEDPARPFAPTLLFAWQAQLNATGDATLKRSCLQQEPKLLPRFAEQYRQLKTLRRQVRRGL